MVNTRAKIMSRKMKEYIVVTPTKNETLNLKKLINVFERQTIKPSLWVIVDESDDNTPNIVKDAMAKYNWIQGLFLGKRDGYLGRGYASACKTGFDFAIEYCKQNKLNYNYIGLVDADVAMIDEYFEKLIIKIKESKIG